MSSYCLSPALSPCRDCQEKCERPVAATADDLKKFGTSKTIGGSKNNLGDTTIIFGTAPNKDGLYPYRRLSECHNALRIKWTDPDFFKGKGEKILFLRLCE